MFYPTGMGNLTIYNKDTKEVIGQRVEDLDYNPTSGNFSFYFGSLMRYCYLKPNVFTFHIELPEPVVTLRITCKFQDIGGMSSGKTQIDSSEHIYKIFINGDELLYSPDLILSLPYGYSNLTFIFEGICQPQTYIHFVDSNDDFANNDLQNYYPNSEHWYLKLPSGFYKITIEKLNEDGLSCLGSSIILIPTNLEVPNVSYTIINKPICNEDYNGSISFEYVTFRDQTTMAIGNVFYYGYKTMFENGMVIGFNPGHYVFSIASGSCSWAVPVTIPVEPISYTYETLWYYRSDFCSIEFGYQFNFDNYMEANVRVPFFKEGSYCKGLLSGSTRESLNVSFIIKNVCQFTFPVYIDESIFQLDLSYTIARTPVCDTGVLLPLLNSEERKRITTDYCRRWFTKLSVDIGISIFSLNISSNPYQSVIIPSILNSTYSSDLLFNYNITTPSNLSMQFIKSGVLTIDSLKESGQYNLTVSDSHCIQTHKFSINQCQLDNGDDGSTNMGLAIGLPIGLVAAGATATGVFFYKTCWINKNQRTTSRGT
ncbi:hypothetical protein DDB_G0288455 [Dictyostelium discoideum AX4]|uniref:Uncharacterized protein n=1 Tax=Dictyostelium discoideum TaxID=44689 RepID=Q54IX8_DICDI|nr:hypothetical protein DDB_G0288455 [Dictyostelium discoideum AX4]EAL63253.1 hypothetical protein DDB_G0288455 [Dictyostelium discoideum AX4]|eukprot:XP_636752.1 hypothetical protein DDB_G0288455 [Dictyostelium discoideum AX4]